MAINDYLTSLRTDPKFIDMTKEDMETILSYSHMKAYGKGDIVIKEGDKEERFYIIAEGEIGISKDISDQVVFFITTLKKGDFFGEMAIISNYPRSANAFAKTETKLIYMDKHAFDKLRKDHPVTFGKLSWVLAKTLAERMYKVEERIKKILSASLADSSI